MKNKSTLFNPAKALRFAGVLKIAAAAGFVTVLAVIMIPDAENMIEAAQNAVTVCLTTIIPALFGYMVISAFLIKSGLHKIIFAPLYYILRFFLRVKEDEFSIILLSLFGGYPVGAKLIADSEDCGRLMPYCYCGSPVFIMTIVGIKLYGNPIIGFYVYLANAAACMIFAVLSNIRNPVPKFKSVVLKDIRINRDVITSSVESASSAMLTVCSMIVFFSLLLEGGRFIFEGQLSAMHPLISGSIFTFGEISNISLLPKYSFKLLPFIAVLTSFGGCCIIMQVAAITKGRVNLVPFMLARFPVALLSGALCRLIIWFFNLDITAGTGVASGAVIISGNPVASVLLVIMSLILLSSNSKTKASLPRNTFSSVDS